MAAKTALHLQNSVTARREDWRRKLVLLGWSYRLWFPLEQTLNRVYIHMELTNYPFQINKCHIF